MKIHMIRHAAAAGNESRCFLGVTDQPLSPAGIAACRKMRPPRAQLLFSSPLARCRQSATFLYPELSPIILPGLREINFGIFEGQNHQQLSNAPAYQQWISEAGRIPPPGGESWPAFQDRCCETFEQLAKICLDSRCKRVAVVTHGGVILAILERFSLQNQGFYQYSTENLGGWTIKLEELLWQSDHRVSVMKLEKGEQNV